MEVVSDEPPRKKLRPKRSRVKRLLQTVQEQIEFYFSDANLRRDPFFRELTGANGTKPVAISVIKSFNCIKELGVTDGNIIRALKNSSVVRINEEETTIQRNFVLQEVVGNSDDCIVYIDCLPADATIGWLKGICKKLGTAKYISLPRHKHSGAIKGFCFVEFSCPEEALSAYSSLNFPRKNFFPNRTAEYLTGLNRHQLPNEESMNINYESLSWLRVESHNDKEFKQLQACNKYVEPNSIFSEPVTASSKKTQNPRVLSAVTTMANKFKKKRCRARKTKKCSKPKQEPPQVKAMMKTDWLELKSSYMRTQRKEMGKVKSILQSLSSDIKHPSGFLKRHNYRSQNIWDFDDDDNKSENEDEQYSKVKIRRTGPTFIPGVVVKIELLNGVSPYPVLPNFHTLKEYFSSHGSVAYVDAVKNSTEGFVRFEDSEAAQQAVLNEEKFSLRLLTGEEEERYWDRLLVSRQIKRSRERPRQRGRDKIITRAKQLLLTTGKKHIKFNEYFYDQLP